MFFRLLLWLDDLRSSTADEPPRRDDEPEEEKKEALARRRQQEQTEKEEGPRWGSRQATTGRRRRSKQQAPGSARWLWLGMMNSTRTRVTSGGIFHGIKTSRRQKEVLGRRSLGQRTTGQPFSAISRAIRASAA